MLLVDAQVESGTNTEFVVDRSVRMAATLLRAHARHRHRLGLVTLGRVLSMDLSGNGREPSPSASWSS